MVTLLFELNTLSLKNKSTCAELEPSAGVRSKFKYIRRFDSIEFSSRFGSSLYFVNNPSHIICPTWYGCEVLAAIDDGVIRIGTGWNISVLFDIVVANFGRVEAEETLKWTFKTRSPYIYSHTTGSNSPSKSSFLKMFPSFHHLYCLVVQYNHFLNTENLKKIQKFSIF